MPSPSPSPPEYGLTGSSEHPTNDPSSSADVPLACDVSGLTSSPGQEAREPYSRGIRLHVNRTRNQRHWQRPPPRTARAPHTRVSVGVLFGAGTPIAKSLLDSVSPCLVGRAALSRVRARAVPPHPPESGRSDPALGNAATLRRCRAGWHSRSRVAGVRCLGMATIVAGAVAMVVRFFWARGEPRALHRCDAARGYGPRRSRSSR